MLKKIEDFLQPGLWPWLRLHVLLSVHKFVGTKFRNMHAHGAVFSGEAHAYALRTWGCLQ
jgi:hypothetical protein